MQRPFPLNLVRPSLSHPTHSLNYIQILFAAIPVLLPTFICMALFRLSLESRKSRARIRLLEEAAHKDKDGNERMTLSLLLRDLEKEVDDAVADFIDASGPEPDLGERHANGHAKANGQVASSAETIAPEPTSNDSKPSKPPSSSKSKQTIHLKPSQKRMINLLNTNPALSRKLKKYDAYIHPIRNSHGTIIVRDPSGFDFHRIGEGVLKHYSDGFVF